MVPVALVVLVDAVEVERELDGSVAPITKRHKFY